MASSGVVASPMRAQRQAAWVLLPEALAAWPSTDGEEKPAVVKPTLMFSVTLSVSTDSQQAAAAAKPA